MYLVFFMRTEIQRAITAYPFDHPGNTRLPLSLSFSVPLVISLFSLSFSRASLRVSLHPIFIQIHCIEASPRTNIPSSPVPGVLCLSTRSPHVLFFSPSFSINSKFYLVRSAVPPFRIFIPPTRCSRAKVCARNPVRCAPRRYRAPLKRAW